MSNNGKKSLVVFKDEGSFRGRTTLYPAALRPETDADGILRFPSRPWGEPPPAGVKTSWTTRREAKELAQRHEADYLEI